MSVPIGPVSINVCCCDAPGTTPPGIAPYVVSLNGLSGILTLDGQGAIEVTAIGGTIFLTLSASAGLGTVTQVAATAPASGFTITGSPINTAGTFVFELSDDLLALENLASTGIACRTASDTWAQRLLQAPLAGITITNPAGIAGNPTFALADDLAAVEGLATTGLTARTGSSTWATRSIAAPSDGISVFNGDGVSGNPTIAPDDDLAALEALSGTGYARRTGVNAWTLDSSIALATTNMTWVDELGSDVTGTAGRFDLPYESVETAIAASIADDVVAVRTGEYNEFNLLKDGVNQWWWPGCDLNFTSANDVSVFSDGADGANAAVVCEIYAPGSTFSKNGNPSLTSNFHAVFNINNSSSDITLTCSGIFNGDNELAINNTTCIVLSDGNMDVTVFGDVECEIYDAIVQTGGTLRIQARNILGGSAGSFEGDGLEISGGTIHLECDTIGSNNGAALNLIGGTVTGSIGSITSGGNNFDGGTVTLEIGSCTTAIAISGATTTINNMRFVGGSGVPGISVSAGTLILNNCYINTAANSSTNPIVKSGGTVILNSCKLIAHSTRDSITAASAQSVVIGQACSANKDVNANITLTPNAGFFVDSGLT